MSQKTISIVTACYNEEENVLNLYNQVREVMVGIGKYEYEHIFIDNSSRDNTVAILKSIAAQDKNVKVIVNSRNFGHIRSPIHALLQARGDAVLGIVADLQDPPPMIADMVREWENGAYCVLGIKRTSEENSMMFWLRKQYYRLVERISSIETIQNFTGFGLYDRKVVEQVRSFEDPYPYFRGMIAEIGLPTVKLLYDQPARKFGVTKNNWYSLYDIAMLGYHQQLEDPASPGGLRRIPRGQRFVSDCHGLPDPQTGLLVDLQLWPCAHADWSVFYLVAATRLPGRDGGVHRGHLHPGAEAPLRRGAGPHQL